MKIIRATVSNPTTIKFSSRSKKLHLQHTSVISLEIIESRLLGIWFFFYLHVALCRRNYRIKVHLFKKLQPSFNGNLCSTDNGCRNVILNPVVFTRLHRLYYFHIHAFTLTTDCFLTHTRKKSYLFLWGCNTHSLILQRNELLRETDLHLYYRNTRSFVNNIVKTFNF